MFTRHKLGPTNKLDCPHAMGTDAFSPQRAESFRSHSAVTTAVDLHSRSQTTAISIRRSSPQTMAFAMICSARDDSVGKDETGTTEAKIGLGDPPAGGGTSVQFPVPGNMDSPLIKRRSSGYGFLCRRRSSEIHGPQRGGDETGHTDRWRGSKPSYALWIYGIILAETDEPFQIESDAGKARFFRRVQVITELCRVSEKKRLFRQCRVTAVIAQRA